MTAGVNLVESRTRLIHTITSSLPLSTRSCIPQELLESSAALPILIDLVRRSITKFHGQHGYCTNCCS